MTTTASFANVDPRTVESIRRILSRVSETMERIAPTTARDPENPNVVTHTSRDRIRGSVRVEMRNGAVHVRTMDAGETEWTTHLTMPVVPAGCDAADPRDVGRMLTTAASILSSPAADTAYGIDGPVETALVGLHLRSAARNGWTGVVDAILVPTTPFGPSWGRCGPAGLQGPECEADTIALAAIDAAGPGIVQVARSGVGVTMQPITYRMERSPVSTVDLMREIARLPEGQRP